MNEDTPGALSRAATDVGIRTFAVVEVAEGIVGELKEIERYYPHVAESRDFIRLRGEFETQAKAPNSGDNLGKLSSLYPQLIDCLRKVNTQFEGVVGIGTARASGIKTLAEYFPPTLEEFLKLLSRVDDDEYWEDGAEAAATMILMGELEGGMQAVVPKFREQVRDAIGEVLREQCDEEEKEIFVAMEKDESGVFELLSLNEDALVAKITDVTADTWIALEILEVRKGINYEYGDGRQRRRGRVGTVGEITIGAIAANAAQCGSEANLWKAAMGQAASRRGKTSRDLRAETARRVALLREGAEGPYLRLLPDDK